MGALEDLFKRDATTGKGDVRPLGELIADVEPHSLLVEIYVPPDLHQPKRSLGGVGVAKEANGPRAFLEGLLESTRSFSWRKAVRAVGRIALLAGSVAAGMERGAHYFNTRDPMAVPREPAQSVLLGHGKRLVLEKNTPALVNACAADVVHAAAKNAAELNVALPQSAGNVQAAQGETGFCRTMRIGGEVREGCTSLFFPRGAINPFALAKATAAWIRQAEPDASVGLRPDDILVQSEGETAQCRLTSFSTFRFTPKPPPPKSSPPTAHTGHRVRHHSP